MNSRADQRPNEGLHTAQSDAARIAFYLPNLDGGGIQQTLLVLAGELAARGYRIDLVVDKHQGTYVDRLPAKVNVVELGRGSKAGARMRLLQAFPRHALALIAPTLIGRKPLMTLRRLLPLVDYLTAKRPATLISAMAIQNILAGWAAGVAGIGTRTIVTEHSTLSRVIAQRRAHPGEDRNPDYERAFMHRVYPLADAIVAVSNGVADDLAVTANLNRNTITTIYNPVVSADMAERAARPADPDVFGVGAPPVVLAVGRLMPEKDFATLIEAFGLLRSQRRARLVILGEGAQREELDAKVHALGLSDGVLLPGWSDNPPAFMSRAAVFVLSSIWEGLPGVLIEAMACGCPVVAADCESGPREILDNGRYGRLAPVSDVESMARAMGQALDDPGNIDGARQRARDFAVARGVDRYEELIHSLIAS